MKILLQRFSQWFHSFDEDRDPPIIAAKAPQDSSRIGMIGWY
jgi:hypothetical protein